MTVASLATMTHVVPSIRAIPVTIPAPGASSSYRPPAARGLSSRKARARIDQAIDALADRELAALDVAFDGPVIATGATTGHGLLPSAEVVDQGGHRLMVRARLRGVRVEPAAQDDHGREDSPAGTGRRSLSSGGHADAPPRPGHRRRRPRRRHRRSRRRVFHRRRRRDRPARHGDDAWRQLLRPAVRVDGRTSSATVASTRPPSRRTTSGPCRRSRSRPSMRRSSSPISPSSGATRSPGSARSTSTARRSSTSSARPTGVERIESCEIEVDLGLPLFVAVATALGAFVPLPVT